MPVQRLAERIDDPADPAVVRRDTGGAAQLNPGADGQPFGCAIGQDRHALWCQPQHLAAQIADLHPVALTGQPRQTRDLNRSATHRHHATQGCRHRDSGDFRPERRKNICHGILPLFAAYPF